MGKHRNGHIVPETSRISFEKILNSPQRKHDRAWILNILKNYPDGIAVFTFLEIMRLEENYIEQLLWGLVKDKLVYRINNKVLNPRTKKHVYPYRLFRPGEAPPREERQLEFIKIT